MFYHQEVKSLIKETEQVVYKKLIDGTRRTMMYDILDPGRVPRSLSTSLFVS